MGERCQVCDGPIVNGRCKLCGMPYRKDEVLYHLNESRDEHYRHATPRARQIMKKQEIPAADRNSSLGRNSSREEIKAHHEKVRQDAVERMNSAKTQTASGRTGTAMERNNRSFSAGRSTGTAGKSRSLTNSTGNKKEKKNSRSTGGKIQFILIMLVILAAVAPNVLRDIRDEISTTFSENETDADSFYQWEDEYDGVNYLYYSLGADYGAVTVGSAMEEGFYGITVYDGSASVEIRTSAGTEIKKITPDSAVYMTVSEGDEVCVTDASSTDCVIFVKIVDSGEL